MDTKKSSVLHAGLIGALCLGVVGCSSNAAPGPNPSESNPVGAANGSTGSVGVLLTVASGVVINTVSYTVSNPGTMYSLSGSIDVSHSQSVSALIGGIPAGMGYTIALNATSMDGSTMCAGTSASFSISAGLTTTTPVDFVCSVAGSDSGSLLVNANTDLCPTIDSVSASPASTEVGGSVALSVSARGPNSAGLTYQWSVDMGGTLTNATSASATFTCASAGTSTLTIQVSDGNDAAACPSATKTQTVTCTAIPDAGAGGG
jgi:hypothetical protein